LVGAFDRPSIYNGRGAGPEEGGEAMASGDLIGKVIHAYDKINVAVLRLNQDLKIGDSVHFHGHSTDFQQEIASMQVEHQAITEAKAGTEVAVKVKERVRSGDSVYRPAG
jgi:putative protease